MDVSGDRGKTWTAARLGVQETPYAFRLWEATVPHPLLVSADDGDGDDGGGGDRGSGGSGGGGGGSDHTGGDGGDGVGTGGRFVELWCRATDSAGEVQPIDPMENGAATRGPAGVMGPAGAGGAAGAAEAAEAAGAAGAAGAAELKGFRESGYLFNAVQRVRLRVDRGTSDTDRAGEPL